ncbi:MAG: response regulator [Anaerolineae bacterium]|nr:response regulator [Anaerolineae bacterium]
MSDNKHILVIGDEEDTRVILCHCLRKLGNNYQVKAERDRAKALNTVEKDKVALVLLETDNLGHEAVEYTTKLQNSASAPKVIWITSSDSLSYKLQARAMDIYRYILKPFSLAEIRRIVQEAIK